MADELIMQALQANYELLESLRERRLDAEVTLSQIDEEIAQITPKIIGLAALVEVPTDSKIERFLAEVANNGLTDAVRSALRSVPAAMRIRPPQVRDRLVKMGVNLSVYQNPMAVIGSTLKRLEESGEIKKTPHKDGPLYNWIRITDKVQGSFQDRFAKGLKRGGLNPPPGYKIKRPKKD